MSVAEQAARAGQAARGPRVVVVSPGRELAVQTAAVCKRLLEGVTVAGGSSSSSPSSSVGVASLIGGANAARQGRASATRGRGGI